MLEARTMKNTPAPSIMARSRLELIFKQKIWGRFACQLILVEVTDPALEKRIWGDKPPTMATDHRHLFYNAAFVSSLTFDECCGVVAHEGGHMAFCHCLRLSGRDPQWFNICCDALLNRYLVKDGITLPKDAVFLEPIKKYFEFPVGKSIQELEDTLSAEQLYAMIKPCGGSGGEGKKPPGQGWGYVVEPTDGQGQPLTQEEKKVIEAETQVTVAAEVRANEARKPGSSPGSLKDHIDRMRKHQLNWRSLVQNFITGGRTTKTSWTRPNKRMRMFGVYLPTLRKKEFGTIVVLNDTSGSVTTPDLQQFFGELNCISKTIKFEKMIVIPVDYTVHEDGIRVYEAGQTIKTMCVAGRGGTSFSAGFDWLRAHPEIKPFRIIYFTDLECSFPEKYHVPTLWVSTGPANQKAPWGRTVHVKS